MGIDNLQIHVLCFWTSNSVIPLRHFAESLKSSNSDIKNFDGISFPQEILNQVEIKEAAQIRIPPRELFWGMREVCNYINECRLNEWDQKYRNASIWEIVGTYSQEFRLIECQRLPETLEALKKTNHNTWYLRANLVDGHLRREGFVFFNESELSELKKSNWIIWRNIKQGLKQTTGARLHQNNNVWKLLERCEYEPLRRGESLFKTVDMDTQNNDFGNLKNNCSTEAVQQFAVKGAFPAKERFYRRTCQYQDSKQTSLGFSPQIQNNVPSICSVSLSPSECRMWVERQNSGLNQDDKELLSGIPIQAENLQDMRKDIESFPILKKVQILACALIFEAIKPYKRYLSEDIDEKIRAKYFRWGQQIKGTSPAQLKRRSYIVSDNKTYFEENGDLYGLSPKGCWIQPRGRGTIFFLYWDHVKSDTKQDLDTIRKELHLSASR